MQPEQLLIQSAAQQPQQPAHGHQLVPWLTEPLSSPGHSSDRTHSSLRAVANAQHGTFNKAGVLDRLISYKTAHGMSKLAKQIRRLTD